MKNFDVLTLSECMQINGGSPLSNSILEAYGKVYGLMEKHPVITSWCLIFLL